MMVIAFIASGVAAQEPVRRLTLAEAVDAALAVDPQIAAAGVGIAGARAGIGEARSALRPHVDLAASALEYQKPMVVTPIHGFTPGQLPQFDRTLIQSNIGATYLLWDGGASRARVQQAKAAEQAAASGQDAVAKNVEARTAVLYLAVLSNAAELEAYRLRTVALDSELARVRPLREVGRAADVEVLRVEAALASAAAERTSIAADLEVAEQTLARATGLGLARTRASNLEEPHLDRGAAGTREDLEKAAVQSNPAVRQARENLLAQQAAITFARAGNLPRLQAAGSLLQFGSGRGDFTMEWNTGVTIRWSAYDGRATASRVAQAQAAADRAEQQVRQAEKDVRDSLDRALADLDQARAAVESLRVAVQRFEEVTRIEKLRLETGVGTQTDYLRSEADLMQSRAGLAAARYRSMMARVEIARITGDLDPAWIVRSEQ